MPTVQLANGPVLRYREWGRPDGALVLLLHGTTSDGSSWKHVAPVLGERFRVVAPDLRGRADSEWTDDYSMQLLADDVTAFMDALGVLAAVVVGHSSGGLAAFLAASEHPERFRMLVLEEMPAPDAAKPPRELPLGPDPEGRWDWRLVIAIRRWRNEAHPDWWQKANKLTVPTMVISGTRSPYDGGRMRDLARAMPDATFRSLDLGHTPHEERPSAFLQTVGPFLAPLAK
jgi:pimeloyl-ACP methyl ester carboxylesterase